MDKVVQRAYITKRLTELLIELGVNLNDVEAVEFGGLVAVVDTFATVHLWPPTVPSTVVTSQHYLPEDTEVTTDD